MRFLTFMLFSTVWLLTATSSALAQITSDLDSEKQVSQYGSIFAIVGGAFGALILLLVITHFVKGMKAEHSRGKRSSPFREEILDKLPKKKVEIAFKGERVPEWKIDNRLKAVRAALKFLACTDGAFSRKKMVSMTQEAFLTYKDCVASRLVKPVLPFLMDKCADKLRSEVKGLKAEGKIRVFGRLEISEVDIVHFEAPVGKENHTFVALVTAQSKDYIKDEKSGEVLSGNKKTYTFQEFWCFRRTKERWLVERIRQTDDMDRIISEKIVMAETDMEEFAKDANPELLREFLAK